MQAVTYLTSVDGAVFLINCELRKDRLLAGIAHMEPFLPPVVEVWNPANTQSYQVRIPDNARRSQTATLLASPNDDIEFLLAEAI